MQRFIALSALKRIPHNNQIIQLFQCAPIHTSSICAYSVPDEKDKQQQQTHQQTGADNQQQREEADQQKPNMENNPPKLEDLIPFAYVLIFSTMAVMKLVKDFSINRLFKLDDDLEQEDRYELVKKMKQPAISYEEFVSKYGNKVERIYFYPVENKAVAIVEDDSIVGKIVDRHRITDDSQKAITIALESHPKPEEASMFSKLLAFYKLIRHTESQVDMPFSFPIYLQFDDPVAYQKCRLLFSLPIFFPILFFNARLIRHRFFPYWFKNAIQTKL